MKIYKNDLNKIISPTTPYLNIEGFAVGFGYADGEEEQPSKLTITFFQNLEPYNDKLLIVGRFETNINIMENLRDQLIQMIIEYKKMQNEEH